MSTRKAVSIGLVILLHALIGYAFITGLAFNVIKKTAEELNVVDVAPEPPPPPEKPPPPPPEQKQVQPPPVVTPPPIVQTPTISAPQISTVRVAPPPTITPTAPQAPPAPPAPPMISQAAGAKGDPAQWVTNDDYPPGAMRDEREGVSGIAWDINTQGRVENCHTTSPSGSSDLDEAACRVITRRGRYAPAKDEHGNPIISHSSRRVRWQIPKN